MTSQALAGEFQRLADWKTQKGVQAVVRTVETIDQMYPNGVDRAERIRFFLRDAYQNWGTLYVLLGVMFLWFARHYEQSLRFHWLITGWTLLLFWVHWFDAYGNFENEPAVLIDLIPFAVFLALGLLRRRPGQV